MSDYETEIDESDYENIHKCLKCKVISEVYMNEIDYYNKEIRKKFTFFCCDSCLNEIKKEYDESLKYMIEYNHFIEYKHYIEYLSLLQGQTLYEIYEYEYENDNSYILK